MELAIHNQLAPLVVYVVGDAEVVRSIDTVLVHMSLQPDVSLPRIERLFRPPAKVLQCVDCLEFFVEVHNHDRWLYLAFKL